jgi:anti-sigma factor RsiW
MTNNQLPVTEDELHAFVDGELPADRREAVSEWLAAHPDAAAQVAAWRAQAEAIRARYGATIDEPVPQRLKIDRLTRRDRSWIGIAAAVACVAFLIGSGTGWVARGATAPASSDMEKVAADALEAYRLYTVEIRHPVEVPGDERAHMTQWLTKRLGYQQEIPDLQSLGLKLVGGRLLPGPDGAAAFYMYEDASGGRFTIYCSKTNVQESALRYKKTDRIATLYWIDDNRAYVVSGPADRERIERITKAIYDQVDRASARRS